MFALPTSIRALSGVWSSPSSRSLLVTTLVSIAGGTVFYWRIEELSWVDSLYLTVMTLTAVGYDDVSPLTTGGRIFTVARSAVAARETP